MPIFPLVVRINTRYGFYVEADTLEEATTALKAYADKASLNHLGDACDFSWHGEDDIALDTSNHGDVTPKTSTVYAAHELTAAAEMIDERPPVPIGDNE